MPVPPQTEIEKQRADWWAEHYKPGMSRDDALRLIPQLISLYPQTKEEWKQKAKDSKGVPEFVL